MSNSLNLDQDGLFILIDYQQTTKFIDEVVITPALRGPALYMFMFSIVFTGLDKYVYLLAWVQSSIFSNANILKSTTSKVSVVRY